MTTSLPYLGIQIPLKFQDLVEVNFSNLLSNVNHLYKHWNSLTLNWSDGLQLVKTMILPKFLYLFHTIPVEISRSQLKRWKDNLLFFIWSGGRHQINHKTLYRPRKQGGLAVPNLHCYYKACHVLHALSILHTPQQPNWSDIFEQDLFPYLLESLLWQKPCSRTAKLQRNPFLGAILKQWDAVKFKFLSAPTRFTTFLNQDWFAPGCNVTTAKLWKKEKVTKLLDLTPNNKLLDKIDLEVKMHINLPWYTYLQIQSMASHIKLEHIMKRPLTDFEKIIQKAMVSKKQLISKLYQFLITPAEKELTTYQKRWSDFLSFLWTTRFGV